QGITHRDIKPSNLILDHRAHLWVADFGLARIESETNLTLPGEMLGTLRYMSPEQIESRRGIVDHRTDVYSLGATLYELLTLEPAFGECHRPALLRQILEAQPPPLRRAKRCIPPELETIVLKALEKSPSDRYATAREMADDLRRFLDDRPIAARRPSLAERLGKWCRRNASLVAMTAIVVMLATIALSVAAVLISQQTSVLRQERQLRRQQEEAARMSEEAARLNRYVVNVNLAAQAWNVVEFAKAREHLASCLPEDGEDDLRGVEWHYLWRLCHSLPDPIGKHEGPAFAACFSPDGNLLATGGVDGARIWEYATGKQIAWLRDRTRVGSRMSFSRDGRLLGATRDDGAFNLWDTSTWTVSRTIPTKAAVGGEFTADGKRLILWERFSEAGAEAIVVTLFDTAMWKKESEMREGMEGVTAGALSADGKTSAAVFANGAAKLWDLGEKRLISTDWHGEILCAAAFCPTEPLLITASESGDFFVRLVGPGERRPPARWSTFQRGIESLEFTPDGNRIISASRDRTIRIWDLLRGDAERPAVSAMVFRDDASLWRAVPAADGHTLASVNHNGVVRRWDMREPPECRRLPERNGLVLSLQFSADGDRLFAAGKGVCVYHARSGERLAELARDGPRLECTAVSPDGKLIAAGTGEGEVFVWDTATYRLVGAWESDLRDEPSIQVSIYSLAFLPDGKSLAVGRTDRDNTTNFPRVPVFIDPVTGRRLPSPLPSNLSRENRAHSLIFSPDGQWTARRVYDHLDAFDTTTGKLRFVAAGSGPLILTCRGDLAATAADGMVRVWRTADWSEAARFIAERGAAVSLAFSPDGRTLAIGSHRGTVRLWNVATGRELMTLEDDLEAVHAVAFSPDGRTLAASGTVTKNFAEVRIWNLGDCPKQKEAGTAQLATAEYSSVE
ncbi:MAG: protein kinase, partial [Pirellulales bacterium]|nr:protein kinase [Pirellulales bacterium]